MEKHFICFEPTITPSYNMAVTEDFYWLRKSFGSRKNAFKILYHP